MGPKAHGTKICGYRYLTRRSTQVLSVVHYKVRGEMSAKQFTTFIEGNLHEYDTNSGGYNRAYCFNDVDHVMRKRGSTENDIEVRKQAKLRTKAKVNDGKYAL